MKLVLMVSVDDAAETFADRILDEASRLVGVVGASRAAVELPATGEEAAAVTPLPAPVIPDVSAVMSFWEPSAPALALEATWPDGGRLVAAYAAQEVVQLDYERTWSEGTTSPGIKQLVFVRRRRELSHQAFSDHWRDTHGPLAVTHHGFWRYVQDHISERLTDTSPGLDGIAELHFREASDMVDRMYLSEEGMRLILDDVRTFVNLSELTMLVTKEYLIP